MRQVAAKYAGSFRISIILALALMTVVIPTGAQKKSKNTPTTDLGQDLQSAVHMPDAQAIDLAIGESLGYWQIGDTESLHKYYADDVVTVSGAWEAPIVGWDNFLKAYQAQRAQVVGARIDRSNTVIKVNGNSAWATYQFVYVAQMEGKMVQYRGHTSLFLVKQANRWMIAFNHSSVVDSSLPVPATAMDSAQPSTR